MDLKEEIKNSIKLSHVVGKNLSLKRRDKSNFIALCPFHKEKLLLLTFLTRKGFITVLVVENTVTFSTILWKWRIKLFLRL